MVILVLKSEERVFSLEYNGGVIYCEDSSPIFEDCLFQFNSANGGGGAMCLYDWSSPEITRTRFSDNSSFDGGAVFVWNPEYSWSWPFFTEVEFVNNTASNSGGAIYAYKNVHPSLIKTTFFQNSATHIPFTTGGGSLACEINCNVHYYNSILWEDTAPELLIGTDCIIQVQNCDLTGGDESSYSFTGLGDIEFVGNVLDADPQFVDENNGDFNLVWSSPCIDMGEVVTIRTENIRYQGIRDDDGTAPDIGSGSYFQQNYVNKPTNLTVSTENDSTFLNWNHGDGAIFYNLYSSDNPDTGFLLDESGTFDVTSWFAPADINRKFYYITGGNNRTRSRLRNIGKRKIELEIIHKDVKIHSK